MKINIPDSIKKDRQIQQDPIVVTSESSEPESEDDDVNKEIIRTTVLMHSKHLIDGLAGLALH